MIPLDEIVRRLIRLRQQGAQMTLLAVCPNSDAVLEAAIEVAGAYNMPMLFAATLNQVDRDGAYTGWTPAHFTERMRELAVRHGCASPLYPCLDHGGPWLKDPHRRDRLSLESAISEVKESLSACMQAGYALLHIDATADQTLPMGQIPSIDVVAARTINLMMYAEDERRRLGLPPIAYEVGTEEVHGGLADLRTFDRFLQLLGDGLERVGLEAAWPCFIVGKVGTDLHTNAFDGEVARQLFERVVPRGSLIKGHYTDWVANPAAYPASGVGAANVGPEFTAAELEALRELCRREAKIGGETSGFEAALEKAVVGSGRWCKWLLADEVGRGFHQLEPERREWLIATGARYVWTEASVLEARRTLYTNLAANGLDAHALVLRQIAGAMERYVDAFHLRDSVTALGLAED